MDESDGFSDTGIEEGEGDSEGVVYEDSVTEVVDLDGEGTESDSDDEMEGSIDDAELGGGATLHPDSNFVMHKGSVFSVAVDPSGSLCCSGGEDDKALVWRLTDGLQLLECQGHKDSVTHVGFSHDGKMVATGDMSGEIQVREVSTGTLVWSFSTGDLEWLQWHPLAHVLLAGTVDGAGWMWKIPSGECRTFPAHGGRNTCGTVLGDGKQAVFGYESGIVKVWDLKTGTPNSSTGAGQGAHRMSVNCVACSQDSTLLLSGSEDSTAKLCSSSSGKVLATFPAGIPVDQPAAAAAATSSTQSPPEQSFSVETVVFCPTLPLALTGSLSGAMAVWDVPSQKIRTLCHHPEGVVKILCSSRSHCCYTGCLDGRVRQWDLQTGEQVKAWQGHPDGILDMALTREEDRLLSCSNDGTIQVFSTQ